MAVQNRALDRPQRVTGISLGIRPGLIAVGVAILVVALLQLVQTSDAVTTNFSIQNLEQDRLELRTQVSQLEADIASLSSLSRIQRVAEEELGLEAPVAQQSLQVNVPWPAADGQRLPTRYAPDEELQQVQASDQPAWWQDLLSLLPFN